MVYQYYGRRLRMSQVRHTPSNTRPWLCAMRRMLLAAVLVAVALSSIAHSDNQLVAYRLVDGTIPEPLTDQPGDPARGRRIVLERDGGDCTICHAMPLPQREFHGTG